MEGALPIRRKRCVRVLVTRGGTRTAQRLYEQHSLLFLANSRPQPQFCLEFLPTGRPPQSLVSVPPCLSDAGSPCAGGRARWSCWFLSLQFIMERQSPRENILFSFSCCIGLRSAGSSAQPEDSGPRASPPLAGLLSPCSRVRPDAAAPPGIVSVSVSPALPRQARKALKESRGEAGALAANPGFGLVTSSGPSSLVPR